LQVALSSEGRDERELLAMQVALTIAGSDPSGGAGLQADLKTFHQHAVYGMSVVTLLTAQNTEEVRAVQSLDAAWILDQLSAVLDDIPPMAAKTGALGNADNVLAVAEAAARFAFPLVVDPVMISKHGASLIDEQAVEVLRDKLLPQAYLITPNRFEASRLAGMALSDLASLEAAAKALADQGARNVLLKGGNVDGMALDVLWSEGQIHHLTAPSISTRNTHGTGCVLSAAITARLARGESLFSAVEGAKRFITAAIQTGSSIGRNISPVNLHVDAT